MSAFRRPHRSRLLLALAFCLALLAPGGAGRAAAAADLPASLAARAAAGLEQGLLRDGASGSLVAGGKRDHRQRPGPALLGVLVAAVVAAAPAGAVHARRLTDRPGHRRCAAAAGPRAPPPPQPAPI